MNNKNLLSVLEAGKFKVIVVSGKGLLPIF
jgi:hypothetical protein